MQTTLENKKKATTNSPRSVHKRKNKVEEGKALGSRMKKEHENTKPKAQKMMRGKVEPSIMPLVVHVTKQIAKVPQMTSPQEGQLKE
jgi:chemotaxis regulatin CheY-phosphate phosphatase CheZ